MAATPPTAPHRRGCTARASILIVLLFATITGVYFLFSNSYSGNIIVGIATILALTVAILFFFYDRQEIIDFLEHHGLHLLWLLRFLKNHLKTWPWSSKTFDISLILNIVLILILFHPWSFIGQQSPPCEGKSICVTMIGDQPIGISDGQHNFLGVSGQQRSFWNDQTTNNAEKLIYQENQSISTSKYITIVVVTALSDTPQAVEGHGNLQGAYVLQKELNNSSSCLLANCLKIRLLVANAGDDSLYAATVAQQIVQLASSDPTFIGVMGWPVSTSKAIDGVHLLSDNHILMVSPTASSNLLSAPYFFRVVPPDSEEGPVAAQYVQKTFSSVKNVAVFYTPDNPYSQTLASGFINAFATNSDDTYFIETYPRGKKQKLREALNDALQHRPRPDLIYFAGYSDDFSSLLDDLHDSSSNIPAIGGDAAYDLSGYQNHNYHDISFTAFASPDEWGTQYQCDSPLLNYGQNFFCDYAKDFDPQRQHSGQYGFARTDDNSILSYDATNVLLVAYNTAYNSTSPTSPTTDDIQQALYGSDGCNIFQGVSGLISFGPDNNPINKAIVILSVDNNHKTSLIGRQGSLMPTNPSQLCDYS